MGIHDLTLEAAPAATDEVPIYDASSGNTDRATLSSLAGAIGMDINGLTEDLTPPVGGDFVAFYDVSEGVNNKVSFSNIADAMTDILPLASGTYSPTLTNVTNLDGSTSFTANYLRVGVMVTVSGQFNINPTTNNIATELGISVPYASDFTNAEDLGGVAAASATQFGVGAIRADTTNNRAKLELIVNHTTNANYAFTFTYRIL